ncbi:MAG: hypothetical protein AAGA63_14235 [Pseudomonadota bacterium]
MHPEKVDVEVADQSIEIYKLYREKVTHEDTLINFRTSWFATLQAFLFTSFALASTRFEMLSGLLFAIMLAFVGMTVCYTTFVSVQAAHKAIGKTTDRWIRIRDTVDPNSVLPAIKGAGSSGKIAKEGSSSSLRLPLIVGSAWFCISIIAIVGFAMSSSA